MSCFQKQLVLHKLPLPVEVLHIVYDYCFKTTLDVQRRKKAAMLAVLNNQTHIETITQRQIMSLEGEPIAASVVTSFFVYQKHIPKWRWGIYSDAKIETCLMCYVCSKCGNFINPKTKRQNRSIESRKPWVCINRNLAAFSKVTCKSHRAFTSFGWQKR